MQMYKPRISSTSFPLSKAIIFYSILEGIPYQYCSAEFLPDRLPLLVLVFSIVLLSILEGNDKVRERD